LYLPFGSRSKSYLSFGSKPKSYKGRNFHLVAYPSEERPNFHFVVARGFKGAHYGSNLECWANFTGTWASSFTCRAEFPCLETKNFSGQWNILVGGYVQLEEAYIPCARLSFIAQGLIYVVLG
jgi:hypothetical protein